MYQRFHALYPPIPSGFLGTRTHLSGFRGVLGLSTRTREPKSTDGSTILDHLRESPDTEIARRRSDDGERIGNRKTAWGISVSRSPNRPTAAGRKDRRE
jgi:hypothetical protein